MNRLAPISFLTTLLFWIGPAHAEVVVVDISSDRWMYPFNTFPGDRLVGSTFGAVNNPTFDDRDAQILVGFNSEAAGIPSGIGADNYELKSATLSLTTATADAFQLDPTYDAFGTYLNPATDPDPGRPIEAYGLGFRNGYHAASTADPTPGPPLFGETDAYSVPGPPLPSVRSAFASDDGQRDVSTSAREQYDPAPWGIANVEGLNPGDLVPENTDVQFALNISDANVSQQLRSALDAGEVFFAITSMHASTQGSSAGIPSFYLADTNGMNLGQGAQLTLDYEVVPEPSGLILAAFGIIWVLRAHRR